MDLTDKKILCELDLNCRTPISKLAKKLRISRDIAAYRINRLEKEGIIINYLCSINLAKLRYKTYKLYFKLWSNNKEEEFVKKLSNDKRVIHFLKTEGDFDYSLSVATMTVMDLDDFIMELKNEFSVLIKDYLVSIVIYSKVFKLNKLLLNQTSSDLKFEKHQGRVERVYIDEKDKKILNELSQSANLPIVDLAKKTKLSIDVIKYRLKKLEKELINTYRIRLNFNKLGYYHYVIMIKTIKLDHENEEKLFSWCSKKHEVIFCTKRVGNYDPEVNAAIRNIEELNKFLKELKSEFSDIIDSYNMIINSELLRLNYIPF